MTSFAVKSAQIDDLKVGTVTFMNDPVTGWKRSTLTITATSANPTKASTKTEDEINWTQIGKTVFVSFSYLQPDATGAAAGTGTYNFALPVRAKVPVSGLATVGSCQVVSGSTTLNGVVLVSPTVFVLSVGEAVAAVLPVSASNYDLATVGVSGYAGSFVYEAE